MPLQLAIIDFGSQFTQLIARNLRELSCYCKIYQPEEFAVSADIKGIVLSGSHKSSSDYQKYKDLLSCIFSKEQGHNIPLLGICYGKQLICDFFGAQLNSEEHKEYGRAELTVGLGGPLLGGIKQDNFTVWMSHSDTVTSLPTGFEACAFTKECKFAVLQNLEKKIFCTQFHPEVTHTQNGKKILQNFVDICGLKNTWDLDAFSEQERKNLVQRVGNNKVIAAVSGGVDSTVAAKFMHNAIGDNLKCIFIDTGLLRKNEANDVCQNFKELDIPLTVVDASSLFLKELQTVEDPEQKRKLIGKLFIDVFHKQSSTFSDAAFLLQGTLYPDVVESGTKSSDKIKSHHNVGGLPEKIGLKIIEPFRFLFKDEVRKIGKSLGVKEDLLMRHPFPGPGLAVRMPGSITEEKIKILQDVDYLYISMLKKSGFYDKIWQAFSTLLPSKSVGVMGDKRSYGYACVLRAVTSSDGMTAQAYPFCSEKEDQLNFLAFLNDVATAIPNKIRGVSRVLYDITSKPPATIEWE